MSEELFGVQIGAKSPSFLKQRANAPAPLAAVAVTSGVVPVLVRTSAMDVMVKTVPVISFGAPDTTVGVPLMVVWTGVMVVGSALFSSAGMAAAPPMRRAARSKPVDACIVTGERVAVQVPN
jgi:ABC-type lipoprotein release transport system permease subunit